MAKTLRAAASITILLLAHVAMLCGPTPALAQDWGLRLGPTASGEGVEASFVLADSPAQIAGIRVGDRVTAIQGREVRTMSDVAAAIDARSRAAPLQLRIVRDGWERTIVLEPPSPGPDWSGMRFEDAPGGTPGARRRVRVTSVDPSGPAARAGLRPEDALVGANGRELPSAAELARILSATAPGASIALVVSRDGWERTVSLAFAPNAGTAMRDVPNAPSESRASSTAPTSTSTTSATNLADLAAAADRQYTSGRWAEAERLYREYARLAPDTAAAWDRLGHVLLMLGRADEAAQACSRAIELAPLSSSAWSNLGTAYLKLDRTDAARMAFAKALEISPGLVAARVGLGSAYVSERNWDAAREQFARVVQAEPDNAAALEALGAAYDGLDRPAESADAYRRAIRAGASGPTIQYALALALLNAGRPSEALAPLEVLLDASPNDRRGLVLYGHVQSRLGNAQAARSAWERAGVPGYASPPEQRRPPSTTAGAPDSTTMPPVASAGLPTAPARQGGPPAARPAEPAVAAAGDKAAVTVGDFQVKAAGASQHIGDGLREMLVTALHNSSRFAVMERLDIAGLAAEQQLSRSRMAQARQAIAERQMEVAEVMIYGAVTEFMADARGSSFEVGVPRLPFSLGRQSSKAHLAIDVRVVDVATGRILGAQQISGEADSSQMSIGATPTVRGDAIPMALGTYRNTPMEQAIRVCIEKAAAYVVQTLPARYFHHP